MANSDSISTLPFIPVPEQLKRYQNRVFWYEVKTPNGCFSVEISGKHQYCRGTQDDLIACGLVKLEWLPGQPGNGYTSNTVVFDATGPRVVVGKVRGTRSQAHIHIRAWGYIQRTVEVRILMTEEQVKQVAAWEEQQEQGRAEPGDEPATACEYRTEGNVVYLLR